MRSSLLLKIKGKQYSSSLLLKIKGIKQKGRQNGSAFFNAKGKSNKEAGKDCPCPLLFNTQKTNRLKTIYYYII